MKPHTITTGAETTTVLLKDLSVQFASSLVHEVRNPLNNIKLSVETLESIIKDKDLKIYLDIIIRNSERINNLIIELLKYQQADEVQAEKHSIQQLLDEVIEMAGDRIRLKNIVIRKEYAAQDCKIILDRQKMKIALTNIIINAIDAMASDKGELKFITKSIDGKYVIQIEDNGCGISKKNLKDIFTPYFTNKLGGLGLGLTATFDILRSNHVGINVKSVEGKGTRFILLFDRKNHYRRFTK
jgi:signal transduction histidine kinase